MQSTLEKEFNLLPDLEFKTMPPKSHSHNESKETPPEFLSLRKTQPKEPQTLTLNKSRSLL
jgi:hypothetical protein